MDVKYVLVLLSIHTLVVCIDSYNVVVVGVPVVYTRTNGGGPDEIRAPDGGQATMDFYAGCNVLSAWYTPYDNINDLSAIRTINVDPKGTSVQLLVGGYQNSRDGRVRIKIYALVE